MKFILFIYHYKINYLTTQLEHINQSTLELASNKEVLTSDFGALRKSMKNGPGIPINKTK